MRFFIFILTIFLFAGCSSKSKYDLNVTARNQVIANTKKNEIKIEDQRVLVLTTYLNSMKEVKVDKEYENFIIAFYLSEDKSPKELIQSISVNGSKEGVKRIALDVNDGLLKALPVRNNWSRYYHVKAPKVEDFKINLIVETYRSGKVLSSFEKDY